MSTDSRKNIDYYDNLKVYELLCTWFQPYNDMGEAPHGNWCAKVVVNKDGWFEGIILNDNADYSDFYVKNEFMEYYQGGRYVYGIYEPNKFIELMKVSDPSSSDPYVFRGTVLVDNDFKDIYEFTIDLNTSSLCGIYSVVGLDKSIESQEGYSVINFSEELDYSINQKEDLVEKIELIKSNDIYSEIYNRMKNVQSHLKNNLLSSYEEGKLPLWYTFPIDVDVRNYAIYNILPNEGYKVSVETYEKVKKIQYRNLRDINNKENK